MSPRWPTRPASAAGYPLPACSASPALPSSQASALSLAFATIVAPTAVVANAPVAVPPMALAGIVYGFCFGIALASTANGLPISAPSDNVGDTVRGGGHAHPSSL
ncbi:hypothetical protein CALVIDRAFT_539563 [Calocera viscosa TUFC12733]|uniref:Uncharacterized protein n=1 Tax=Calocera viscosa (strain TUFC12733) TaxID=1330018 RepID=A0A167JUH0_CALVF|nr:hypothetical protein CALVIDRAFT_539563 [Calocera viscosa TUFC12733]